MRTGDMGVACALAALPGLQAGEPGTVAIPHRTMALAIQLGVLLCATQTGSLIARRLRLPGLVGELAAGIVVGPFALGGLELPGFPAGVFPASGGLPVSAELYGLCSVAAVLLVLMLGLQTDLRMFVQHSGAGAAVGGSGALVSFVLGDLAGVLLGGAVLGRPLGFMDPPCLLLGVVATATSADLAARLLAERNRLGTPEGVTTLAGTVVDDVLGLLALTGVLAVISGAGPSGMAWGRVGTIAARALSICVPAALVGLLAARRARHLLKRFRGRTTAAVVALGLTLVLAGLCEHVGLAVIVGAYVAGLTLSRTELAPVVREKLEPLGTVLTPVLFGVMGMLVDPGAFLDGRVLVLGLAYAALSAGAKVAGCGAAALLLGCAPRRALQVGVGMVPRGEVALLAAGVGLASGALPLPFFSAAVLMVALTTLVASPALGILARGEHAGPAGGTGGEALRFPFVDPRQAAWVFRGLQDTLQRDGFSVHVLEQGGGAGLALRGRTSIAFRRDNNDIVFNCEAGEVPVVKTAVLYVVRELRTTLEAMRRPLDVQRMLREVPGGGAPADGGRDLRPFLRPDLVKLRLKGDRPEAILRELVELASAAGLVEDMDEVLGAVLAREQSMSTGLERGIAVPHCRTDSVPRLVCAIGLKPEGVDFGALDGQPSRIFVLTLSPASDPAPHVVFMSQIVQALTPAVCRRLLRAESTHEAIAILSSRPEPGGLEPPVAAESPARHAAPHTVRPNAIKEAVMVPRLRAADREGVVDELLAVLAARQPIMGDLSQVRRQVLQREQALSTGLERGIAVPHCRTAAVDRVLCAVGLRPEGLDFGSRDGAPTQIVVLILASTSMPTPYAQTLALLLHALERIPRAELFAYTDAEALHARIWATVEEASGVA